MADLAAPQALRPWRMLVVTAVVFFGLRFLLMIMCGWSAADEAWILQIVRRTSAGEVLYRDVFFNCTPLAIYLARAACAFTGAGALALKGLCAGVETVGFLATLEFVSVLCRQVDWRTPKRAAFLALVMLVIPGPLTAHLYNELATLLILLTGIAVLRWRTLPTRWGAAVIGALVGCALAEKQNVGAYLAVTSMVSMCLVRGCSLGKRAVHGAIAVAAASAVVMVILLPTIIAGGIHALAVDTFLIKGQYLRVAGVSFFEGFEELWHEHLGRLNVLSLSAHLIFPLALLAIAAFWAGLFRKGARNALLVAAPTLLVLGAGVYPRADVWHVGTAAPGVFIVLAVTGSTLPQRVKGGLTTGTAIFTVVLAILLMNVILTRLTSSEYAFSKLPYLRGVLMHEPEEARLAAEAALLARLPQPVFIVSPEAAGLYLISQTQNPTPYDYVISSELPAGSQEKIIADFRAGRIKRLVLNPRERWSSPPLLPEPLQTIVEQEFQQSDSAGMLRVYQKPTAP